MSAGSILIDVAANTTRLQSDLGKADRMFKSSADRMSKQASQMGKVIGGVAAGLATGAFASWIKGAIDSADAAAKSAQMIGVTTEALTGLQYAASLSDVSTQTLNSSLLKFNKNIAEAANGSKDQAQAFADIGLSVKDANGNLKSADKLLLEVSDKFAGYEDGAQKSALAQDLFGKSGAKMIPLLNGGASSINELTAQAERFGLVVSSETSKAAEQFNDSLTVMGSMNEGIAMQIAGDMLPVMNDFTGLLIDVSENSDAAATSASVLSGVLKALATAGIVIGASFTATGQAIGAAAAVIGAAARGDFAQALDIAKNGIGDYEDTTEAALERINKLWSGDYKAAGEQAANTAKTLRESIKRTNVETEKQAETTKKATDAIQSQVAALQLQATTLGMSADQATLYKLAQDGATDSQLASAKAALDAVSAFEKAQTAQESRAESTKAAAEVEASTFSDLSKAYADYQAKVEALRGGLLSGDMSQERYDAAVAGLEEQMAKAEESNAKTTTAISAAWEGAAKNIQGTMADFLFDPFQGGLDGMVQSLGTAIRRMVADAVAADLANKLFGSAVGGTGDGWVGAAASWAGSFFGGGKAIGGPVMAGKLYEVGENNRPETFMSGGKQYLIPGNSGAVHSGAGSQTSNVINISLPNVTNAREARQARAELSRSITGAMSTAARYS